MKESNAAIGGADQLGNCTNNSDNNNHPNYHNESHLNQIIGPFTAPPSMINSLVPGLATVPEASTIDQHLPLNNYQNMPPIPQNSPLMSPRSTFGQNDIIDEEEEMIFPISDLKDEVRFCSLN